MYTDGRRIRIVSAADLHVDGMMVIPSYTSSSKNPAFLVYRGVIESPEVRTADQCRGVLMDWKRMGMITDDQVAQGLTLFRHERHEFMQMARLANVVFGKPVAEEPEGLIIASH